MVGSDLGRVFSVFRWCAGATSGGMLVCCELPIRGAIRVLYKVAINILKLGVYLKYTLSFKPFFATFNRCGFVVF